MTGNYWFRLQPTLAPSGNWNLAVAASETSLSFTAWAYLSQAPGHARIDIAGPTAGDWQPLRKDAAAWSCPGRLPRPRLLPKGRR